MKARVRDAFGVDPSDAFGSTEGLFGFSEPGASAITLATDLAIVELVDDENQPVAAGQRSSKVLLSSLLNRTQPLIRYELTDAMRLVEPAADHGYPRVEVDGRSDDVLT